MKVNTECLECGQPFKARAYGADFCGAACKQKFNNRRATRGALLYDLTMAELESTSMFERYQLAGRKDLVIAAWRKEDEGRRRTTKMIHRIHEDTFYVTAKRLS